MRGKMFEEIQKYLRYSAREEDVKNFNCLDAITGETE